MNDLTHRINWLNIFNFCRIIINRSVDTWLNALFTSRNRHEKMFFEFIAVWILCNKHSDASIVDLFFYVFHLQTIRKDGKGPGYLIPSLKREGTWLFDPVSRNGNFLREPRLIRTCQNIDLSHQIITSINV